MSRVLRYTAPVAAATVGLGAAVATAHGVFEVVSACGVPPAVAALYPLITDGLALVGYASALRLPRSHRRWAWMVVVLAAGLSGVGQATILGGGVEQPPTWLRFGVGAWPAVAAALVAHLLFLMASSKPAAAVRSITQPNEQAVQGSSNPLDDDANASTTFGGAGAATAGLVADQLAAPAKQRALAVAREHRARTDALPSVTELAIAAGVARGTAATALRELRSLAAPASRAAREQLKDCQ